MAAARPQGEVAGKDKLIVLSETEAVGPQSDHRVTRHGGSISMVLSARLQFFTFGRVQNKSLL